MVNRLFFRLWFPLGLLIIGLLYGQYSIIQTQKFNETAIANAVTSQLSHVNSNILDAVGLYEYGVRGVRGAVESVGFYQWSYDQQLRYFQSRDYDTEYPGARGFGLIKKISEDELDAFLAEAAKDRNAPFELKQLSSPQDPLFIIQYIEPQINNEQAIGLDIGSEANRRHAALTSAATKSTQLTAPITLVQASDKVDHGFLLLHPIFESKEASLSPKLLGWSYAPLLINEILDATLVEDDLYRITVSDTTATPAINFYSTDIEGSSYIEDYQQSESIVVFGRQWTVSITPTRKFLDQLELATPTNKAFTIGVITLVLIGLTYLLESLFLQSVLKLRQRIAFASVVDNSSDGIIGVDEHYKITHWNDAADRIFNLRASGARNHPIIDWLSTGINSDEIVNTFKRVAAGDTVKNMLFTLPGDNQGEIRTLNVNISPIIARDKFTGATISLNDVSEIKNLQRELLDKNSDLENEAQLLEGELKKSKILEQVVKATRHQATLACDSNGAILSCSKQALTILGYSESELESKLNIVDVLRFTDPDIPSDTAKSFKQLIRVLNVPIHSAITKKEECNLITKKNERLACFTEITAVNEYDTILGYVFQIQITGMEPEHHPDSISGTQKNHSANYPTVASRLSNLSNQQVNAFTANVFHEFRSPLTAIHGYISLFELSKLDDVQRDYLTDIKRAVNTLTHSIDDVLDLAFLDHGVVTVSKSEFELDELLAEVSQNLFEFTQGKRIEIHFDVDINVPYILKTDRHKLKRILLHLGNNAIKFTNYGEVVFKLSVAKSESASDISLQLEVSDTGIGIPDADQGKIFNEFWQLDNSESRSHRGLGIGLSIVKKYVHLLEGDINVTSTVNRGSSFKLTFKAEAGSPPQKVSKFAEIVSPIKVLIVDDNATSAQILQSTMGKIGWNVTVASNSFDALEIIQTAVAKKERFDIALIDWVMPEKDGWELGKEIKQSLSSDDLPILIMASARTQEQLYQQLENNPGIFNGCLTKPITRTQIFDAYIDAIQTKTNPILVEKPLPMPTAPLRRVRVLVVDDNPTNQLIVKSLLKTQGASVAIAANGKECLKELETTLMPYDAVLMDIHMAGMDGLETAARIRQNDLYQNMPIIPMTTNLKDSVKEKCRLLGMTGHIEKPFSLKDMVNEILKAKRKNRAMEAQERAFNQATPVGGGLSPAATRFGLENDIDLASALVRFNNMPELYDRALQLFIVSLGDYANQLENKELTRDDVVLIFHTLKGTAASLGFIKLAEMAKFEENQLAKWVHLDERNEMHMSVVNQIKSAQNNAIMLKSMLQSTGNASKATKHESFTEAFNELKNEVSSFNMHAIDTFQKITVHLKDVSPDITDSLMSALNGLDFKRAEQLMSDLEKLLKGLENGK
ncbi:response regulator [Reinekea marina]|uniref:histidine kinase n=2 Tax=Reinekea marina TaxID=1310421 RepID=A0ABV7WWZ2_9GAMM